jgi:hypothetical protein
MVVLSPSDSDSEPESGPIFNGNTSGFEDERTTTVRSPSGATRRARSTKFRSPSSRRKLNDDNSLTVSSPDNTFVLTTP